jgi:uncharacterized protein
MDGLRFLCDEQLGKLARWLRIIGLDAEYEREAVDEALLARARHEGRFLLTRDSHLAEKGPDVKVIHLEENYPAHQLREVVEMFRDQFEIRVFSRCPACNGEVAPLDKAAAAGRVPDFVYRTQEHFTYCPHCGRVYWQATHRDRIEIQLRDILGELYQGNDEG